MCRETIDLKVFLGYRVDQIVADQRDPEVWGPIAILKHLRLIKLMDKGNKMLAYLSDIITSFISSRCTSKVILQLPHWENVDIIDFFKDRHAKSSVQIVFNALFYHFSFENFLLQILRTIGWIKDYKDSCVRSKQFLEMFKVSRIFLC